MVQRLTAAVVVAMATLLAAIAGPAAPMGAPAGAAVGDPPAVVTLGSAAPQDVVVHPGTGRVFVARGTGIDVFAPDLTPVGTVAVSGAELAPAGDAIAVLTTGTSPGVTRIDAATLATATFSLGTRIRPSGLVAEQGRALTTAGVGGDRAVVEVDLTTGATKDLVTGMGSRPWLLAGSPWKTIAVEYVAPTSGVLPSSRVWQIASPTAGAATVTRTGTIPVAAVRQAELTHDVIGLTVTADNQPGKALAFRLSDLTAFPTVDVGDGPVTLGSGYLLGVSTAGLDHIDVMDPFHVEPAARLALPVDRTALPGGIRRIAFGPDDTRLYAVFGGGNGSPPARLVGYDLAPSATTVSPQVLDVEGGAVVTVEGRGLAGATTWTSFVTLTPTSSTDDRLVLTAGPGGGDGAPIDLTVRSRLFVPAPEAHQIRLLQLGPYTDARALAVGAHLDFARGAASAAAQASVDRQLLADGDPGAPFVALSRDLDFRSYREVVLRLYRATLGRPADTGGLEYWTDAFRAGRSWSWVVRSFMASSEFTARYASPTDAGFVDLLYQNVLGRTPDAGGRAYWVAQLRRGMGRPRLVQLFAESPENQVRTGPEAAVTLLALGMLGRVPTTVELARWLPGLEHDEAPTAVANEILRSTEYAQRHAG